MSAPNVLTSHAFVYFNTNDADDDIHTHMRVTYEDHDQYENERFNDEDTIR